MSLEVGSEEAAWFSIRWSRGSTRVYHTYGLLLNRSYRTIIRLDEIEFAEHLSSQPKKLTNPEACSPGSKTTRIIHYHPP